MTEMPSKCRSGNRPSQDRTDTRDSRETIGLFYNRENIRRNIYIYISCECVGWCECVGERVGVCGLVCVYVCMFICLCVWVGEGGEYLRYETVPYCCKLKVNCIQQNLGLCVWAEFMKGMAFFLFISVHELSYLFHVELIISVKESSSVRNAGEEVLSTSTCII